MVGVILFLGLILLFLIYRAVSKPERDHIKDLVRHARLPKELLEMEAEIKERELHELAGAGMAALRAQALQDDDTGRRARQILAEMDKIEKKENIGEE